MLFLVKNYLWYAVSVSYLLLAILVLPSYSLPPNEKNLAFTSKLKAVVGF